MSDEQALEAIKIAIVRGLNLAMIRPLIETAPKMLILALIPPPGCAQRAGPLDTDR